MTVWPTRRSVAVTHTVTLSALNRDNWRYRRTPINPTAATRRTARTTVCPLSTRALISVSILSNHGFEVFVAKQPGQTIGRMVAWVLKNAVLKGAPGSCWDRAGAINEGDRARRECR